jgi:hypothetical protein
LQSGAKVSAVVAGELHPNYTPGSGITNVPATGTLQVVTFGDPVYATSGTAATVTFRHAAPNYTQSTQPIQVGYVTPPSSTNGTSFTTLSFGGVTSAISLPSSTLNQPLGFYGLNPGSGTTLTPSQLDPSDTGNTLPFNNDINLTMYLVDGGGATSQPSSNAGTSTVNLIGIFDPNG